MRFTIEQTDLKQAIAHAATVVQKRNTIPILSHVCLTATGGQLHLTATDLDAELVQTLPATIEVAGTCTVNSEILKNIASKLPGASVIEMHLDNGVLTVASGRSSYDLHTRDVSEYPVISSENFAAEFQMPASDLARAISKTNFAVSTEETRYYLNGLYLHSDNQSRLCLVGTDGHRMARHVLETQPADDMPGVIIPNKTVTVLRKLIENSGDDQITVELSEQKARFTIDSAQLTSKVIDGQFPDYARIMPTSDMTPDALEVDAQDLKSAVDRVMIVSDDKANSVIFDLSDDQLTARVPQATEGRSEEIVACSWSGGERRMGFNSKLILSAVTAMESENAQIHIGNPGDAARIEDGNTTMIVMPMRVNSANSSA